MVAMLSIWIERTESDGDIAFACVCTHNVRPLLNPTENGRFDFVEHCAIVVHISERSSRNEIVNGHERFTCNSA